MMNRDTENTAGTLVGRNVTRYTTTDMHDLPGSSPGDRRT